ncbi:hypothetical protein FF011L_15190 [Roseimaritima multifibrata]|uniref:Uncharacterized protein n=1 Tax=Roseimaritima multifibrata TaxID=1930274 RepID=A0A517MD07_9BACT|nr:hypothetical protein FF011L_15190 [Roseimaritima multifibrata]
MGPILAAKTTIYKSHVPSERRQTLDRHPACPGGFTIGGRSPARANYRRSFLETAFDRKSGEVT